MKNLSGKREKNKFYNLQLPWDLLSVEALVFALQSFKKKKKKQSAILFVLSKPNRVKFWLKCLHFIVFQTENRDRWNPAKRVGFWRKIVRRRRSRRRLFLQKFWSQGWNCNGELQWLVICWWRRCRFGVCCWFHLRPYF